MWEKQPETNAPPILPSKEEWKAALTPPITPKERRRTNYILRVQSLVCAAAVAAAVGMQRLAPGAFSACRAAFTSALESGANPFGQEELLKFTQAVEAMRTQVAQVVGELGSPASGSGGAGKSLDGQGTGLTGSGGEQPAVWPFVPEGDSLQEYAPPFDLALPLEGFSVTSGYGWRRHPLTGKRDFHTGIDLAAAEGTPIRPAAPGVVLKSERSASYGNNVLVLHTDGAATRYCHMQYVFVRQGQQVDTDNVLGTVGQTGVATVPHLHFELLENDVRHDPAAALGLG